MRTVRTSLPPDAWEALAAEAAARDLTLAAWAREVLTASLPDTSDAAVSRLKAALVEHDPTASEWAALASWLRAEPVLAKPDLMRPSVGSASDPGYRRAVWAWAQRQGFKP